MGSPKGDDWREQEMRREVLHSHENLSWARGGDGELCDGGLGRSGFHVLDGPVDTVSGPGLGSGDGFGDRLGRHGCPKGERYGGWAGKGEGRGTQRVFVVVVGGDAEATYLYTYMASSLPAAGSAGQPRHLARRSSPRPDRVL